MLVQREELEAAAKADVTAAVGEIDGLSTLVDASIALLGERHWVRFAMLEVCERTARHILRMRVRVFERTHQCAS
jgi:hypothetical protein